MPWQEVSVMDQRHEFVQLAMQEGVNRRELCRRFGISAEIGYKWLRRWAAGDRELADRSRRPQHSPSRSSSEVEAPVLRIRDEHPAWGPRKIAHLLARQGSTPPSLSTIDAILRRHGRIDRSQRPPGGWQRFEKEAPNLLWQMDFKGRMPMANGRSCHPLTVVDDHSRYALCLQACDNEQNATVQQHLSLAFRRYGLPNAFFVDNGTPWGDASGARWTRFGVWLLKLGIDVRHSRPYHPQSRGKNERFHRTLKAEVFALRRFRDLAQVQHAFDTWRTVYNCERPHQGIGLQVPADRYRPSPRSMPDRIPEPEYDQHEIVRIVPETKAYIRFKGRWCKVPQAFCGERVAVRPQSDDGKYGIFFAAHQIATIDLTVPEGVSHVSEQVSVMYPG
jgi:transposase InsO family protein